MRRFAPLLPLALSVALAGCGDTIDLTNASIGEVARMTAAIDKPEPGQWRTQSKLVAFDPGPARTPMGDAMRAQVGETNETEACLDPEEANKPLFADLAPRTGADCTFRRFHFEDATLDAAMTCRNADGVRLEVTQRGHYSPRSVDLTAVVRRTGADGRAVGGMTTRMTARRTGDCTQ